MTIEKRYWDANAFLGYFNRKEPQSKKDRCESVLKAADNGKILIVTSYITYVEVIKIKGEDGIIISKDNETMIREFFEQEYIVPRIVDRQISELARELIWTHNLNNRDAIHAATAVKLKIRFLDTFDEDLIRLSGVIGNPQILIAHPPLLEEQGELFHDEDDEDANEDAGINDREDESEEDE